MADCEKTIKKRNRITLLLKLGVSIAVALLMCGAAQLLLVLPQSAPVAFRWGGGIALLRVPACRRYLGVLPVQRLVPKRHHQRYLFLIAVRLGQRGVFHVAC